MSQQSFPKREKTFLDSNTFCLYAPLPGDTTNRVKSRLLFRITNNNPRVIVYTNDPAEADTKTKGVIQAELSPIVFSSLLELLKKLITDEPGTQYKLENKNHTFFGGKRSDEAVVKTIIVIGKDATTGVLWISVLDAMDKNRVKIKFEIVPGEYHRYCYKDGTSLERSKESEIYTLGLINLLKNIMPTMYVTGYVEPKPQNNNNNYKAKQNKETNDALNGLSDNDLDF